MRVISNGDPQQSLVYQWENTAADGALNDRLTLDKCRILAEDACYRHRPMAAPPVVTDGRGSSAARAYGDYKISLPIWARTPAIVLHEVAHVLTPSGEAHGPGFVRMMCDLWKWHVGKDYTTSARKAGIDVSPIRDVGHPVKYMVAFTR